MQKIKKALSSVSWGYLVIAILLGASGVLFLAFEEESLANAARIVGGLTVLIFLVRFVLILAERERSFRFAFRMIGTVCALLCGGIMLIFAEDAVVFFCSFVSLFLIVDGAFKLQTTISLRRYKIPMVWVLFALSILLIGGGYILLELEMELAVLAKLLGAVLLVDAVSNLMSLFLLPVIDKCRREENWNEEEARRKERETRIRIREENRARVKAKKEARRAAKAAKKAEAARLAEEKAASSSAPAEEAFVVDCGGISETLDGEIPTLPPRDEEPLA